MRGMAGQSSVQQPLQSTKPYRPIKAGTVGLLGSTANLANAAIGAGVLAFPLAFAEAGLVLGPALTVFFALTLGYTLHVIATAADAARRTPGGSAGSYQEIVKTLLGRRAEKIVIWLQVIYLTGCNVCMLIIICDQVKPILEAHLNPDSFEVRHLLVLVAWGVCFPLSLIRDMSVFAWPSLLSQIGIFFAVAVVIYHSISAHTSLDETSSSGSGNWMPNTEETHRLWWRSPAAAASALPLICFGFQCHLTFSLVYDSLASPTTGRIDIVAYGCMALCAGLYITMGVFGYLLLGDKATADVLADLHSANGKMELDVSVARACVAVKVACSYAMLCHVTKTALKDLILDTGSTLGYPAHFMLTAAFVCATMVLALLLPGGLQQAMAFSGIIVVIMVAIFPGILKVRLASDTTGHVTSGDGAIWPPLVSFSANSDGHQQKYVTRNQGSVLRNTIIGYSLILFGVGVGVLSLVVEIDKLVEKAFIERCDTQLGLLTANVTISSITLVLQVLSGWLALRLSERIQEEEEEQLQKEKEREKTVLAVLQSKSRAMARRNSKFFHNRRESNASSASSLQP